MSPLLKVNGLNLERGGRELFRDLSFEVNSGQLIQLHGPNGAGKTSLLRILAGLSRYGFDGTVEKSVRQVYLGHQAAVKSLLSPRENLAWHVDGEGVRTDEQIEHALAQVGLYGYEDLPSNNLSAGQHRRVNLARLFLSDSPLWLLDEPFAAIDAQGISALESLLVKHVSGGGAVILTSHQALSVEVRVHMLSLNEGLVA